MEEVHVSTLGSVAAGLAPAAARQRYSDHGASVRGRRPPTRVRRMRSRRGSSTVTCSSGSARTRWTPASPRARRAARRASSASSPSGPRPSPQLDARSRSTAASTASWPTPTTAAASGRCSAASSVSRTRALDDAERALELLRLGGGHRPADRHDARAGRRPPARSARSSAEWDRALGHLGRSAALVVRRCSCGSPSSSASSAGVERDRRDPPSPVRLGTPLLGRHRAALARRPRRRGTARSACAAPRRSRRAARAGAGRRAGGAPVASNAVDPPLARAGRRRRSPRLRAGASRARIGRVATDQIDGLRAASAALPVRRRRRSAPAGSITVVTGWRRRSRCREVGRRTRRAPGSRATFGDGDDVRASGSPCRWRRKSGRRIRGALRRARPARRRPSTPCVFEQYKSQGAERKTYLPMPFAHVVGGAGWGFHVRTSRRVWFDVGSRDDGGSGSRRRPATTAASRSRSTTAHRARCWPPSSPRPGPRRGAARLGLPAVGERQRVEHAGRGDASGRRAPRPRHPRRLDRHRGLERRDDVHDLARRALQPCATGRSRRASPTSSSRPTAPGPTRRA